MWYKIRVKTKILVQRYFHKGGTTMMYNIIGLINRRLEYYLKNPSFINSSNTRDSRSIIFRSFSP